MKTIPSNSVKVLQRHAPARPRRERCRSEAHGGMAGLSSAFRMAASRILLSPVMYLTGRSRCLPTLSCSTTPTPTRLLAVEEPENQLYPALMRELVEEFHDYARRGGQVFVSTHSPDFLNGAELDEIRWLVKEDGFTKVRRASESELLRGPGPRRRPARRALEAGGIRPAWPALEA